MSYHDSSMEGFVYDLAGDVVLYTDCNGSRFTNTWDSMGRKTSTTIAPASGIGGTTSQAFQYDGLGRLTSSTDTTASGGAVVNIAYDSLGRGVEEGQVYGANTRYLTNDAYTSLAASQLTYPNERQVNTGHDALYRKNSLIEQSTSASIASWQYFGPSRVAEVALGNGIIQTMMNNARTHSAVQLGTVSNPAWGTPSGDRLGYDGSGRMIAKRYLAGGINSTTFAYNNATPLVGDTTSFDPADNKFYERALHAESRSFLYQPVGTSGTVASPVPGYDSVNRLVQYQRGVLASGGGGVANAITLPNTEAQRSWDLDGLGNWRLTEFTPVGGSQTVGELSHNKLNEITQIKFPLAPASFALTYDGEPGASNGNLANDGTLIYAYDALNRLIQINRVSDGLVIGNYVYDTQNRRIRKTISNGGLTGGIPNGTTDYLWLGWQVMEERDGSNAPIRQYVWGLYIDECVQLTTLTTLGQQSLPAGAYYLCQDLLYRAVALTDSGGAVIEAYDTDAYGNTIIFTATGTDGIWFTDDDVQSAYGANDIIFCGYRYDAETYYSSIKTGLYYVRNRAYSSAFGRWLQRDPIGYKGGINLYEYVGGMPVVFVDPNGTSIKDCPKNERRARPGYKPTFNGCGDIHTRWIVPQYAQIWVGAYFTPACNNHDICYGTCNSNKQDCDLILEAQLRVACVEWWDSLGWNKYNPIALALFDACYAEAKVYWEAVNVAGQSAYNAAQSEACICCNK